MKLIAIAALCVALGGCGTTQAILGHCELPEKLSKPLDYLPHLPTDKPLPRKEADQRWAEDRAHDEKSTTYFNETRQYVQDHCQ